MIKSTSKLMHEILHFVMNDDQVAERLRQRDTDPPTEFEKLSFNWIRKGMNVVGCDVIFNYMVPGEGKNRTDDIKVEVAVFEGPSFKIVGLKKF